MWRNQKPQNFKRNFKSVVLNPTSKITQNFFFRITHFKMYIKVPIRKKRSFNDELIKRYFEIKTKNIF